MVVVSVFYHPKLNNDKRLAVLFLNDLIEMAGSCDS
jgi:hypothetical protein